MRMIITGSKGMLGGELLKKACSVHQVLGVDLLEHNILEFEKLVDSFIQFDPEVIIHTAAMTDVDKCESESKEACLINGIGTKNVVEAAQAARARLVYISTDYVFDGEKEVFYEDDRPNPLNVYGKSKLEGEMFVRTFKDSSKAIIVRTSWLFGPGGKNFVYSILREVIKNKELKIVIDQIGLPTYTVDLAEKVLELACKSKFESQVVHLTNAGDPVSWNSFARSILRQINLDPDKVKPITTQELKRPALRPYFSTLRSNVECYKDLMITKSWGSALFDFLSKEGFLKERVILNGKAS